MATAATCTTDGTKTFTCTACDAVKTEDIAATGHTWNKVSGTATTRTEGTTTYECAGCSETKTESSSKKEVPSTAISLDTLGAKSVIADSDLESYGVSATSIPAKMAGATYYKFGVYPQTIKAEEVTVDETIINLEFDEVDYYLGSDNNWYAKCVENAFETGYTYSDGTTVAQSSANSTKYFKVEPIVWRKLEGSGYLLAERELTAKVSYYSSNTNRIIDSNTVYPNNYKHSRIRAFLNGYKYISKASSSAEQIDNEDFYNKGFLQTAFTESQRNQIQTTTVDNSANSTTDSGNHLTKTTTYACSNTQDKIFLLSELEATTTSNGFAAYNSSGVGNSRIRLPTDYAKANYAYQITIRYGEGVWWLRSPCYSYGSDSASARLVGGGGTTDVQYYVYQSISGVVPALSVTEW